MSDPLDVTTELDAVNICLAAVGEAPVVSLDGQFTDAELARTKIRERMRSVQSTGWVFNTELSYSLAPDNDGHILLPANLVRFVYAADPNIVVRGDRLYDRTNHTDEFTDAIIADKIVLLLPFDVMPEPMRQFVAIAAARRFQDDFQGSDNLHKYKENDELRAWAALQNYEAEIAGFNVVDSSALASRIKGSR